MARPGNINGEGDGKSSCKDLTERNEECKLAAQGPAPSRNPQVFQPAWLSQRKAGAAPFRKESKGQAEATMGGGDEAIQWNPWKFRFEKPKKRARRSKGRAGTKTGGPKQAVEAAQKDPLSFLSESTVPFGKGKGQAGEIMGCHKQAVEVPCKERKPETFQPARSQQVKAKVDDATFTGKETQRQAEEGKEQVLYEERKPQMPQPASARSQQDKAKILKVDSATPTGKEEKWQAGEGKGQVPCMERKLQTFQPAWSQQVKSQINGTGKESAKKQAKEGKEQILYEERKPQMPQPARSQQQVIAKVDRATPGKEAKRQAGGGKGQVLYKERKPQMLQPARSQQEKAKVDCTPSPGKEAKRQAGEGKGQVPCKERKSHMFQPARSQQIKAKVDRATPGKEAKRQAGGGKGQVLYTERKPQMPQPARSQQVKAKVDRATPGKEAKRQAGGGKGQGHCGPEGSKNWAHLEEGDQKHPFLFPFLFSLSPGLPFPVLLPQAVQGVHRDRKSQETQSEKSQQGKVKKNPSGNGSKTQPKRRKGNNKQDAQGKTKKSAEMKNVQAKQHQTSKGSHKGTFAKQEELKMRGIRIDIWTASNPALIKTVFPFRHLTRFSLLREKTSFLQLSLLHTCRKPEPLCTQENVSDTESTKRYQGLRGLISPWRYKAAIKKLKGGHRRQKCAKRRGLRRQKHAKRRRMRDDGTERELVRRRKQSKAYRYRESQLVFKQDLQEYAQVKKTLKGRWLLIQCFDGKMRRCHIPGSMREWVKEGDTVLVSLREFQDEVADVIYKYHMEETRRLIACKEINYYLSSFLLS